MIGILCVMFGVYLFIAFLSFFYTGNADQSKLENLPLSELSSIKNEIRNWTGAFGIYPTCLLTNGSEYPHSLFLFLLLKSV